MLSEWVLAGDAGLKFVGPRLSCYWPISAAYFLLCIFANFLSRTSSDAIPILCKNPPTTEPRSLPTRNCIRSIQFLAKAKMVRTPATQLVRCSCQKLIAHARSLSPTPSTGKLPRRQTNDVDSHPNTRFYSTLFRKNYAMLATVFAAGFAWEMYEDPTIPTERWRNKGLISDVIAVSTLPWTRSGIATTEA